LHHLAIDGCADSQALEVGFCRFQICLGLQKLRFGRVCGVRAGLQIFFTNHFLGYEFVAQLQFVLRLLPLCVGSIYRGGVGRDQSPLRTIVDCEKRVAGLHMTADLDVDLGNDPGDLRPDRDVLGVCFGDPRPGDERAIGRLRCLRDRLGRRQSLVGTRRDYHRDENANECDDW
jgi:hypothetical protein